MASLHVSSPISDVEMVKRERKLKMMEEVDEGGFDVDDDDGRRMVH